MHAVDHPINVASPYHPINAACIQGPRLGHSKKPFVLDSERRMSKRDLYEEEVPLGLGPLGLGPLGH